MEKILSFSEPFLNAEYIEHVENYPVQGKMIIINIDTQAADIGGVLLAPMKSSIFSDVTIAQGTSLVLISVPDDDFLMNYKKPDEEIIKYSWHHVFDFYNLPHLKNTMLWLSEKEGIGNLSLNLWYAPKGTHCGLHNEHLFREVHTQLLGIGSMQLFHENDPKTLYQEIIMSPGYTHDPLYFKTGKYPWHQYVAETDCVWLAIEDHAQ